MSPESANSAQLFPHLPAPASSSLQKDFLRARISSRFSARFTRIERAYTMPGLPLIAEKIPLILPILHRIAASFTMDFHVAKMVGEPFSGSAQTRPPPRSAAFIAALRSCIRGRRGECARVALPRGARSRRRDWPIRGTCVYFERGVHFERTFRRNANGRASLSGRNVIRDRCRLTSDIVVKYRGAI